MRSWVLACKTINAQYPDMRARVMVTEDDVCVQVCRWLKDRKRCEVTKHFAPCDIDQSFVDVILIGLSQATQELLNYPYNHVIKTFQIVGGHDYEQRINQKCNRAAVGGEQPPTARQ